MKPKIPPVRLASDDCVVNQNGTAHKLHEGEWVEIIRMDDYMTYHRSALIRRVDPTGPEADSQLTSYFEGLCTELAQKVVSWNWTDLLGQPLPQPAGRPDIIRALTAEEIYWLRAAVMGETQGERKNA